MDRWKFVNEKWIPRPVSREKGYVLGIAVLSYRSLPHAGRLCVGDSAFLTQPPPLRGTSFRWKEGMTTRAPSLGRGCRAQRCGVGFLFGRRSRLLFTFPIGKRGPRSDALVYDALETIFSLSFIPLVPYPARFARRLPHAGKALCQGQRHSHKCRASILCKQKTALQGRALQSGSDSIILRSRILRDFSAYPHHFLS